MATPIEELAGTVKSIATGWTSYTAFASFVLYAFGYLALRFHLTALGIGTDLAVLDERYLFTGARFLIYLVAALPTVVLLVLIALPVLYLPYRLSPGTFRQRLSGRFRKLSDRPVALTVTGIVLAVLLIQLVMRQCFFFNNLLLAEQLPEQNPWLSQLVLGQANISFFFSGMLGGTAITAAIFFAISESAEQARTFKMFKFLLGVLVTIQILLLPVNYGVFIVDKSLPRVASIGSEALGQGEQAWLVWEGKEGFTYLLRRSSGIRSLVTLPRADVKKTEITKYDAILPLLFSAAPERRSDGK